MVRKGHESHDSSIVGSKEDLAKAFEAFSRSSAELVEYFGVLQRRIADLTAQLERSKRLAAIGEMSATLAHEIRNPLSGISLSVSILKRRLKGETERDLIRNIEMGIERMEGIIRDILNFSQDLVVRKDKIDWCVLANKVTSQMRHRLEGSNVRVEIEGEGSLVADFCLIERVLVNLIDNSFDALDGKGMIFLIGQEDEAGFSILVRDNGPGFSQEVLNKAVEPFFTTKTKGTGLGLAIVSRIIEAHSGRMSLSNWEQGAEVKLWLPS